ncbi:MAG: HlyC/CorC family transporter [Alphaproteobacteria bacterium]|nr:HlyC/CorC family transporter [Alphaproteobacteria bacterium]
MESATANLVVAFLLLVANGFYVAAEFALVKAKGFRIESAADAGSGPARRTVHMQKHIEPYLAACQLGITMASLGLGWVGEPTVAALLEPVLEPLGLSEETLHSVAFLVGFLVFSSLHIVVGEQVPKTLAIRKAEPMCLAIAYPLQISYWIFFPLTWILNKCSRGILKLIGIDEGGHDDVLSDAEIRSLVDVSTVHGDMHIDKAEMIHNVFKFDERSVARVMIPRIEADVLRQDATVETNMQVMRERGHSRYPVVEGKSEDLLGIVLVVDLTRAILAGEEEPWTDLSQYLREPLVVPETQKVSNLFDMMRQERAHMACIIDEYGTFVGIVTLEDLLEEIVGEIADETDISEQVFPIEEQGDHWVAHGLASLADLERLTGFAVPDTYRANTVSGLLMRKLRRIPELGDIVEDQHYRFTVEELKGRRAERVRIELIVDQRTNDERAVIDEKIAAGG